MRITLFSAALLASGIAAAATPVDGWYTSVFGGYTNLPSNINITNDGLLRAGSGYHAGYNAGGRIGYQSNPIRYEAEYTFLYASTKKFQINGISQEGITGFASGNFAMANLYYDFPDMLPAISPYLGGGLGYAYLQANLESTGPSSTSYFTTNDSVFAYQVTAGITYNFAENYAVNLAGRYIATNRPDYSFGKVFQSYIASAGAVYRFDYGNYK